MKLPYYKIISSISIIGILASTGCKKEEVCIDESKIDPNKQCSIYCDPVCGCDGNTYCNGCEAEKRGVVSYTDGPC